MGGSLIEMRGALLEEMADTDTMVQRIEATVTALQAKILPPPDIAVIVDQVMKRIRVPEDGKDADPVDIGKIIETVTKLIRPPRDGQPGRDALELDVLQTLDLDREYPRGTWVRYLGGIIRAVRDTDPVIATNITEAGWAVMVDGVRDVEVEGSDDGRSFTVRLTTTSGRACEQKVLTHAMIYRNVWTDDREYERGDVVSYDGSMWHCDDETTRTHPKEPGSKSWRLIVKRGADGKSFDAPVQRPPETVRLR